MSIWEYKADKRLGMEENKLWVFERHDDNYSISK